MVGAAPTNFAETAMTKCCEACHTVNRDRAQYCRGCAGRFRDLASPGGGAGMSNRGTSGLPNAALAGVPIMPRPAPSLPRKPGISLTNNTKLLGLLFPAFAVVVSGLVVWQQWSWAAVLRSQPTRGAAQAQSQQAVPALAPVATAAPEATRQGEPAPTTQEAMDPRELPTAPSTSAAVTETVPQESLLALAMEHSTRGQQASEAARSSVLEPADPVLPNWSTESDMGISSDVTVDSVTTNRPAITSRPVVTSARPSRRASSKHIYGPTPVALQALPAQGITGPCDRYNPFGEVTCANVPAPSGQGHASYRGQGRSVAAR
jgi:hypothetical protein